MKKVSKKRIKNKQDLKILLPLLLIPLLVIVGVFIFQKEPEPVVEVEEEPPCYYDASKFAWDEEGIVHFTDPDYECKNGIDVSQFQKKIDWELVKSANLDFVIIRAGYRGAIEGLLHTDERFEYNMNGALENDIPVGVYWYSSAISYEELDEEIEYLLELIAPYEMSYPVVYDMEPFYAEESGGRISTLSMEEKTDLANYFCARFKEYGYQTMIYGNADWLYNNLDFSKVQNQEIWYASYASKPSMPDRFTMWQYSEKGTIPGIKKGVDLNIYIQKKEAEKDE